MVTQCSCRKKTFVDNLLIQHGIIKKSAVEDERKASKKTQMSTTKQDETKKSNIYYLKTATPVVARCWKDNQITKSW